MAIDPSHGETNSGETSPRFELTTFLEGKMRAWGVFEDRFGRLRRRFAVEMEGHWEAGIFHLEERFAYDDGRVETRTWQVTPKADGAFTATCADCVGEARGRCSSDSIEMAYAFRLRLPSRTVIVDFEDRIYRMGAHTAVNRATMRKWGIRLGELSLFFSRPEAGVEAIDWAVPHVKAVA